MTTSTIAERTQQHAHLIRAFDSIPAYIAYVTPDLAYASVNRTYVEAFGRPRESIEGHSVAEVLGPSFEYIRAHLEAALGGESRHFETPMGTVDSRRTLSVSHIPDFDTEGKVLGVTVYGVDVTDRKLTESALMQSEKLAAVGRLASSIAHEINNPLEAVTNLLYLARMDSASATISDYLETADRELRRVSVIANQTLRFHKQASNPRAISAADLFETVLSIYEGRLRNSNIEVLTRFRGGPVTCFEGDIRQVLNNLVANAIDAMHGLGGRLFIRSHASVDHATGRPGLTLTVADTGHGMSPAVLNSIFDAFYTTKGIGGTGLGLWVSKEVVDRHAGVLHVRSRETSSPCGTVFRLFLPLE